MSLVHDVHVQVGLLEALPQQEALCHILEHGLVRGAVLEPDAVADLVLQLDPHLVAERTLLAPDIMAWPGLSATFHPNNLEQYNHPAPWDHLDTDKLLLVLHHLLRPILLFAAVSFSSMSLLAHLWANMSVTMSPTF